MAASARDTAAFGPSSSDRRAAVQLFSLLAPVRTIAPPISAKKPEYPLNRTAPLARA